MGIKIESRIQISIKLESRIRIGIKIESRIRSGSASYVADPQHRKKTPYVENS
jgi:hypothetical protein